MSNSKHPRPLSRSLSVFLALSPLKQPQLYRPIHPFSSLCVIFYHLIVKASSSCYWDSNKSVRICERRHPQIFRFLYFSFLIHCEQATYSAHQRTVDDLKLLLGYMAENPVQALFHSFQQVSNFVQHHLSNLTGLHFQSSGPSGRGSLFSVSSSTKKSPLAKTTSSGQPGDTVLKGKSTSPVTKEELGRATWTFLHTLGAQYPDNPTRQQKKDVKELVQILSRMYPCKECADHFKEVLRANPVQAGSHAEFSQWLCHVHNVVNRSLGKPVFPCERVDARWGKLECEQKACEIIGDTTIFGKI